MCVVAGSGKGKLRPEDDRWDYARVNKKIKDETEGEATLVLPLASIIETGNHISQAGHSRYERAQELAEIMNKVADNKSPWAAFSDQRVLWSQEKLKELAESWPDMALRNLSLGDATISDVAAYYSQTGWHVEILTGDQGLKALKPVSREEEPRRRRSR